MRKILDSVLRQLPWKQNWCLILVIRLSFRKVGYATKEEDISFLFTFHLLIMKDYVYRESPILAIYRFQRRKTEQKLPRSQIAVTMVTVTTMWFDLAFQLAP